MKSHEIVQEYLRKYSLPDTSQRIRNILLKIFSQNFFSNFFSKYFFPNFFVKIFLKIFCQNFPQNFISESFSKFFPKLFRGFRTRDTHVLRAPHARHTRVASTPRGIFLVIISMRIFCQNFPQNFFPEVFSNFFRKFFF